MRVYHLELDLGQGKPTKLRVEAEVSVLTSCEGRDGFMKPLSTSVTLGLVQEVEGEQLLPVFFAEKSRSHKFLTLDKSARQCVRDQVLEQWKKDDLEQQKKSSVTLKVSPK